MTRKLSIVRKNWKIIIIFQVNNMGKEISLKETNNHAKLDLLQAKKAFPTPQSEHQEN